MRFTLTLSELSIDPAKLYLGPKQIERMLKTQEIKTTLPLNFPERTNEGHSAPAYNTL